MESFRPLVNAVNLDANLPVLNVILPVGISFYMFQSLSYTLDVFSGHLRPEKSPGVAGIPPTRVSDKRAFSPAFFEEFIMSGENRKFGGSPLELRPTT